MESLESLWECGDDELPDVDDADGHPQPAATPPVLAQPSREEPLEDGEIGPASGSCRFQFTATDLDAAIQSSKRMKKVKEVAKRKGKKKKKSSRQKSQEMNPKEFIARTSRFLKEPKHYLIKAAVERLGIDIVRDLVHEVKTIEANGGQMILSGKRRRTPGGVLWNVLRSRYEEDFKAIMAVGRTIEKEQREQKRKVGVDDMLIDEQPSTKRRRTGVSSLTMAPTEALVKRTGVTVWPSRRTQMDDIQFKADPDNSCTLTRVQNAWAEGVKKGKHLTEGMKKGKHIAGLNDEEMLDDGMSKKPSSIVGRLRIPIQYDDL